MHPIYETDVIILMATALSSKRRPADLVEIIAAADLIQGFIPFPEKLGDAIERLSIYGLMTEADERFTLTDAALEILSMPPKKATTQDAVIVIKATLATYNPREKFSPVILTDAQLSTAVRTHKAARKERGKNLLMSKPKADRHFKAEGRWRRVPAPR